MKKIHIVLSFLIVFMAWSCGEDENSDPIGDWELSAPTLSEPANDATIALEGNGPNDGITFAWTPAVASNKFIVTYEFLLVPEGSTDYENPLLKAVPANSGKDVSINVLASEIDYALWTMCVGDGEAGSVDWVIVAHSIEKTSVATRRITFTRFESAYTPSTLFLLGEGTEAGDDLSKAIPLRARKNSAGDNTGVFDVYTSLVEGKTFYFRDKAVLNSRKTGGSDGNLSCGTTITAPATGVYKITVDWTAGTYAFLKINKLALIGDAVAGWGTDVPLTYVGNGKWEDVITFVRPNNTESFIFRINENWGLALKRVVGGDNAGDNTAAEVFPESDAGCAGITVENFTGLKDVYKVSLDLGAADYRVTMTPTVIPVETIIGKAANLTGDAVTGSFDLLAASIPSTLFLVSNGQMVAEFTKNGNTFSSVKYIPLQASMEYSLNSAADGTGTTYDGNADGTISVDHDQAYLLTIDFTEGTLAWKHYNIKLFHWNSVGGWDARTESLMTYTHPLTYEVTANLTAGYASKFNSPWDVQFGTSATTLTGTMTNGGADFFGISETGSYIATIVSNDTYTSATYSFVKQ